MLQLRFNVASRKSHLELTLTYLLTTAVIRCMRQDPRTHSHNGEVFRHSAEAEESAGTIRYVVRSLMFCIVIISLTTFTFSITTYEAMTGSFNPRRARPVKGRKTDKQYAKEFEKWEEDCDKSKGALHLIEWDLVILDEGHYIKKHTSKRSKSAAKLNAKSRITLSGTPLLDRPDEAFSYLSFLKHPDITTKAKFTEQYLKGNKNIFSGKTPRASHVSSHA